MEAAEPLILTQYSLNKLDKQNREREVAKLTGDATFAFEDTEEVRYTRAFHTFILMYCISAKGTWPTRSSQSFLRGHF